MLIRPLRDEEHARYNQVVHHPLQSWEWGQFRAQTDVKVERIGFFPEGRLEKGLQLTFHPVPVLNRTVGYFPKGDMPDEEQLAAIEQLGRQHNAIFIKMEPNIAQKVGSPSGHAHIAQFLENHRAVPGRSLFTKYTFQLDLTPTEDQLFANLESKTRYNVNLAYKKGVRIIEDTTQEGMQVYLDVLAETTKRQGFYAHGPQYFKTMWETLGKSGMLHIFHAVYESQVISSWIMFMFDGVLYYPYGASRSIHRNVMASNLMMWEMIRYGKANGCTLFDMWGSLGPEPDPKHPWFGFHRFKKGYNGELMEFMGTYDLVLDPMMYQIFQLGDSLRWQVLRLKTKLGL